MSFSERNINILKNLVSDTSNLFYVLTLPEENIDGAAIPNAPRPATQISARHNVNQAIHQDLVSRCLIVMRCARNDGFLSLERLGRRKNIHPNICAGDSTHHMFFILFFCDRHCARL